MPNLEGLFPMSWKRKPQVVMIPVGRAEERRTDAQVKPTSNYWTFTNFPIEGTYKLTDLDLNKIDRTVNGIYGIIEITDPSSGTSVQIEVKDPSSETNVTTELGDDQVTDHHAGESPVETDLTPCTLEESRHALPPSPNTKPPEYAEPIVRIVVSSEKVEEVLGDFSERFVRDRARFGETRARLLYIIDTCKLVIPMIVARLKTWGLFAVIAAALRRSSS